MTDEKQEQDEITKFAHLVMSRVSTLPDSAERVFLSLVDELRESGVKREAAIVMTAPIFFDVKCEVGVSESIPWMWSIAAHKS